jgi:hypothetical protein
MENRSPRPKAGYCGRTTNAAFSTIHVEDRGVRAGEIVVMLLRFREFVNLARAQELDEVFITEDGEHARLLHEGRWLGGRFKKNIRVDRETHHRSGEQHFHVYGRKGDVVGVLRMDGSISHGGKPFRLSHEDAKALRDLGVPVPENRLVEWIQIDAAQQFLLE